MAMKKKTRGKLILVIILLILLLLMALWYVNFRATRSLDLNFINPTGDALVAPEFLYSFSGEGSEHLAYPLGIIAKDDIVYVADSDEGRVFRFTPDGEVIDSFGADDLDVPLYLSENPLDGNIYVTDRRKRGVFIFTPEGEYVDEFLPNLPDEVLPTGKDRIEGVNWVPIAIDFAPDGRMYVTDFYAGHRVLFFDAEGKYAGVFGRFGEVNQMTESPGDFQFPNGVEIHNDEVWVVDSNNRRIQVYDLEGNFSRIVPTSGLPRGMDFLARPSDEDTGTPERFVLVDTLAHDATIWDAETRERVVTFGGQGVLEGQFLYPNNVDVGAKNLIFITDSGNTRVQVFGWPEDLSPIPPIRIPQKWGWCLTPLLLLPLLLLLRKKKFLATQDFVEAMYGGEVIHTMPHKRRKWLAEVETYEVIKDIEQDDVRIGELFEETEHSESDAQDLVRKLEIEYPQAVILSLAQRVKVFCTEDLELRRLAKLLDVDVVNREEFLERFEDKKDKKDKDDKSAQGAE